MQTTVALFIEVVFTVTYAPWLSFCNWSLLMNSPKRLLPSSSKMKTKSECTVSSSVGSAAARVTRMPCSACTPMRRVAGSPSCTYPWASNKVSVQEDRRNEAWRMMNEA